METKEAYVALDKRLERLEDKVDKTLDAVSAIHETMATNTQSLIDHMRRTELLEKAIVPVQRDMNKAKGAIKLVAIVCAVVVAITGVLALFH